MHPDTFKHFHTVIIHKDLKSAEDSLAAPFRSTPLLNLDNPAIHLRFFKDATKLAFSSQMKCHLRAEATGIKTRPDAWKWIAAKVNRHLLNPQWLRADLMDNIGVTPIENL